MAPWPTQDAARQRHGRVSSDDAAALAGLLRTWCTVDRRLVVLAQPAGAVARGILRFYADVSSPAPAVVPAAGRS